MEENTETTTNSIVNIPIEDFKLEGSLENPEKAEGIVLFAHGSGSSRHSPRNKHVAFQLQERNLATLLVDLLTSKEEEIDIETRQLRFNIEMLGRRLVGICDWLTEKKETKNLLIGIFGASTGAAAALIAAAKRQHLIGAIVSRGGRPDLAIDHLKNVKAPTLLIVGGDDLPVIGMNDEAYKKLNCAKKMEIVEGATHLFEEPGKLDEVSLKAGEWFHRFLSTEGKSIKSHY